MTMGRILQFTGDPHRETRDLMPWLLSGRLDSEEQARVEAHLAMCDECSRELTAERELLLEANTYGSRERGSSGISCHSQPPTRSITCSMYCACSRP